MTYSDGQLTGLRVFTQPKKPVATMIIEARNDCSCVIIAISNLFTTCAMLYSGQAAYASLTTNEQEGNESD